MRGRTADEPVELSPFKNLSLSAGRIATRKVWLPKVIYNALPYFYFFAGIAAFLATLYISEWFWVLPHYLLFAVACLHLSFAIFRKRDAMSESDLTDPDQQSR